MVDNMNILNKMAARQLPRDFFASLTRNKKCSIIFFYIDQT